MAALVGLSAGGAWAQGAMTPTPPVPAILRDADRDREVPTWLYEAAAACRPERPCPVALLSPGWGLPATAYGFLARALQAAGFGVVAVQDSLPGDPPLPATGNVRRDRLPAWQRGVATLRFVQATLATRWPAYDWQHVVLVGHSHGGDVSARLASEQPGWVAALVTLDHRRVPLPPASAGLRVLSLRGSDFPADPGVLPVEPPAGLCLRRLPNARHDDMQDDGPAELRARLAVAVVDFLVDGRCGP